MESLVVTLLQRILSLQKVESKRKIEINFGYWDTMIYTSGNVFNKFD